MILQGNRLAAATAVAAAFSLAATPAWAVELPRPAGAPQAWDAGALDAADHRRHGDWDDDWDDDDIDGEDILTGVLILGGLAAIAGIAGAGRQRQQQSYPAPQPYPEDSSYQAPARDDAYRGGGMAEAVDTCVAEVEADRGAVGSVDRASRSGEGWYVAGALDGGAPFSCWIDGAGRVTDIEAGDYGAGYEAPAEDDGTLTLNKQAIDGDGRYALAAAAE